MIVYVYFYVYMVLTNENNATHDEDTLQPLTGTSALNVPVQQKAAVSVH